MAREQNHENQKSQVRKVVKVYDKHIYLGSSLSFIIFLYCREACDFCCKSYKNEEKFLS